MQRASIVQITSRLQELSPEMLAVVYDFISYLLEGERKGGVLHERSGSYETMLASEDVLRRDWDRPEEDDAWADL